MRITLNDLKLISTVQSLSKSVETHKGMVFRCDMNSKGDSILKVASQILPQWDPKLCS